MELKHEGRYRDYRQSVGQQRWRGRSDDGSESNALMLGERAIKELDRQYSSNIS